MLIMIKKKLIIIYFFFFITLILISSILVARYFAIYSPNIIDEDNNIILSQISYGWGNLIDNLFNYGRYFNEKTHLFYDENFNQRIINIEEGSYVSKLPFLPILTVAILQITKNFYYFLIIKNIILYSISLKNLNKKFAFFITITILIIINPYILFHTLGFYMSEQYGILFIPCIFIVYLSRINYKYEIISVIIFILYLSKGTFFLFCLINVFFFIIFEKKSYFKYKKFYPALFLLMASLVWGGWSFKKTKVFAFGMSSESLNTIVAATALNHNFNKYYPNLSADLVHFNYKIPIKFKNEWEAYKFFEKKNIEYLKNNKLRLRF